MTLGRHLWWLRSGCVRVERTPRSDVVERVTTVVHERGYTVGVFYSHGAWRGRTGGLYNRLYARVARPSEAVRSARSPRQCQPLAWRDEGPLVAERAPATSRLCDEAEWDSTRSQPSGHQPTARVGGVPLGVSRYN